MRFFILIYSLFIFVCEPKHHITLNEIAKAISAVNWTMMIGLVLPTG